MLNSKNNFLLDALKYLPIKVLPAASGLLTIFILTKNFTENNFIDYTFIITTILLVNQLLGGWVNSVMMYFVPQCTNEEDEHSLISQIFYIQIILSGIGIVLLLSSLLFVLNEINICLIAVFIFMLQISINFINSFLQSKRLIKAQILSTTIQSLFQIIALIVTYYFFKNNLFVYLIIYSLSFLLSLISLIFSRSILLKLNFYNKQIIKRVLSYGIPICIWFFSTQFYSIGDRLLMRYFNITNQVVNYVAFRDLSVGLSGFVSMPLLFASHPIIMNLVLKEGNKKEAIKIIEKNINILLIIFLPCIVIIFFYGDVLIRFFIGKKYLLSPLNMLVILLSVLIGCISIYLQKGLETSFNTKYMLKVSLVVSLISLILNIALLPKFGVDAAVLIGLFSQLLYAILIFKKSNSILQINLKSLSMVLFCTSIGIIIFIRVFLKEIFY